MKIYFFYLLYFLITQAQVKSVSASVSDFVLKTSDGELEVVRYKTYYYVSFDLVKPSKLILYSLIPVRKVEISPKSYNIAYSLKENITEFELGKPGYILLRLNDSLKIFVFAEVPEIQPSIDMRVDIVKNYHVDNTGQTNETRKIQQALNEISGSGKTLFFPEGKYKSGQVELKSNSRVYFSRGSELFADTSAISSFYPTDDLITKRLIYIDEAKNVELAGYGSIIGNGRILRNKFGDEARMRLILVSRSKNINIKGLMLKDPGSWNTHILLCEDVILKNLKLLNDIGLSNTDGFDPDAVKNLNIENCFAYCSDDNVAVKTTGLSGLIGNVDKVTIRNCVFLTKKSALKVGTETRGEVMKNITFESNDVIECDRGMSIYVNDGAILSNIVYSNNRFERNYPDLQQKAMHFAVSKRNENSNLGSIKNLLVQDCIFLNTFPKNSVIRFDGEGIGINATIKNLIISGRKIETLEMAGIEATNSKIIIK